MFLQHCLSHREENIMRFPFRKEKLIIYQTIEGAHESILSLDILEYHHFLAVLEETPHWLPKTPDVSSCFAMRRIITRIILRKPFTFRCRRGYKLREKDIRALNIHGKGSIYGIFNLSSTALVDWCIFFPGTE